MKLHALILRTFLLPSALALALIGCTSGEPVGSSTAAGADTTRPSTPTGLTAAAAGSTVINVAWNAATDDVGVVGYGVRRNGLQVATTAAINYSDTGLAPGTLYNYTVVAGDAAGNVSFNSAAASATTAGTPDTIPPSTPGGLSATATGQSTVTLTWNASTDNIAVTGYVVKRNGTQVATRTVTNFSDAGLTPATTYNYTVSAFDAAGNSSSDSTVASATTTGAGDTTPPTAPPGLTATTAGSTAINLSWNASTDNIGVAGYRVLRNGIEVATPSATNYSDTGLSPGTTYNYAVTAFDAAGNNSPSSTASATTSGTPPGGGIPATLGWFEIPNTRLETVCAGENGFPQVLGNTGCRGFFAWSGGVADTTRNRLVMWGGGHADYAGNEVVALSLSTLTLERLNNPSSPIRDGCNSSGIYADGKPVSRHTYNHLAYIPTLDVMFAWGGSMWQCGNFGRDAWFFNFSNLSWTPKSSTNGPVNSFNLGAAFDPNNGLVYMTDLRDLRSYNPTTDTWTKRSNNSSSLGNVAAVIDPVRQRYIAHSPQGGSTLFWFDISSSTATVPVQSGATSGCSGFIGREDAAMEYDARQDRIVGWVGGNTIYILNPDTRACTTVTHAGGPAADSTGTFGRLRYFPSLNLFVVCNRVDRNCHSLRLTPP